MPERVHVVSLSGGRDSAAVGIWAALERDAGRMADLRYVHADVGSGPRGMEPETRGWLEHYVEQVLTPRGLTLDIVDGRSGPARRQGYEDAWASVYERKWRRHAIPKGVPVTWIVGFRADEASEKRRVQTARFADENGFDEHWRPFVELGVGLRDVRAMLKGAGVREPAFYEWTTRSGCVFCFYKPRRELAEAAKRFPQTFERMADHEEAVIAATGKRGSSPWVVTRGGTLREVVAGVAAQGELDLDERDCGDPLGTCTL